VRATPPTPSVAHLLSAPLSQLLTETGARLVDSSIRDREFLGADITDLPGATTTMQAVA
jgi:hypothetical protein